MALETTVFTFKISVPFSEWVKGFDSPEAAKMHESSGVTTLYRGISKNDPSSAVVVHQGEEGAAIKMFEGARPIAEAAGHIWDSTIITSYLAN